MNKKSQSQVLLYQAPDGRTRLEVRMQDETVWLTQAQMAELFQRERSVITKHIRNIFEEGELVQGIVRWHKVLAPAGDSTCVFRDSAFAADVAKTNIAAILQQHGLENVRNL
jgi:hypothetical protein